MQYVNASCFGPQLSEYVAAARRHWPELAIEEQDFARYVEERADLGQPLPLQHAGDLLLAYACSRSLGGSVEAFRRAYEAVIDRVLAYRRVDADLAADARQVVLAKLLVGDASKAVAPKISSYRGTGPLQSWVATTTSKAVLSLQRDEAKRRQRSEHAGDRLVSGSPLDPELGYLKQRYRADVEQAVIQALSQLSDRESTLLRLKLGERMSIDALGAMYSVNRATAARWVAAARVALVERTQHILRERLLLSEAECISLVALVQSQLDVSIVRRLSEADA